MIPRPQLCLGFPLDFCLAVTVQTFYEIIDLAEKSASGSKYRGFWPPGPIWYKRDRHKELAVRVMRRVTHRSWKLTESFGRDAMPRRNGTLCQEGSWRKRKNLSYISLFCQADPTRAIYTNFGLYVLADFNIYAKYGVGIFKVFRFRGGDQFWPFPLEKQSSFKLG